MSDTTKIEWTDYSWSPWEGCTKVSPGCLNCYAEARDKRMLIEPVIHWGKGAPRRRTKNWNDPVKWNRQIDTARARASKYTAPRNWRVFPSLCDWLDDEVPIEWLADFLKLIHDTPNLDWLLLTKRPEIWIFQMARALDFIGAREGFPKSGKPSAFGDAMVRWVKGEQPPENVSIGTSVEDQPRADVRVSKLLKIPAGVRFLSLEPLIGPVSVMENESGWPMVGSGGKPLIHWLIIGGESGPGARPCNVEWIRDLVRQGRDVGVPCFVKQLGAMPVENGVAVRKHHPKGGDPADWPSDLRVREFPKVPA